MTSYAAETANATNTITAVAEDSGAEIAVTVNGEEVSNGSAATWADGENTLAVNVVNGTAEKTYTATVTKA